MPSAATIQKMIDNKISVSTITVYPHQPGNVAQGIRELARQTGGKIVWAVRGQPGPIAADLHQGSDGRETQHHPGRPERHSGPLAATSSDLVKGITPGPMPPLYGYDLTGRKDSPLIEVPMIAGPKHDPILAHWQAGLGKTAVYMGDAFNRWDANWVDSDLYEKFWSQVVRGVSRSPFSSDFETEMTTDGEQGHIVIRATKQGNAFNNFLNIAGTIAGGGDLTPHPIRPLQTGPGTYEADFDASAQGSYICYLNYTGQDGKSGSLLAGTTVNSSPEMRNLQSNDALLKQIADRTGGRFLKPFDVASADLFARDGLTVTDSPQSIWDLLVPWLLALIIVDVAVRRIAWDWPATKKMAIAVGGLRAVVHDDLSQGGEPRDAEHPEARARGSGRAEVQTGIGFGSRPGDHGRRRPAGSASEIRSRRGRGGRSRLPSSAGRSTSRFRPPPNRSSPRAPLDSANTPADCSRQSGVPQQKIKQKQEE